MGFSLTATAGPAGSGATALDPEQLWVVGLLYGFLLLAGLVVDLLLLVLLLGRPPRLQLRMGRLLRRPLGLTDVLHLAAVLGVLFALAGLLVVLIPLQQGTMMAVQSLLFHWLLFLLFLLVLRHRRVSAYRAFGLRARHAGRDLLLGVIGYLAMLPGFVLCTLLYRLLLEAVGYEPSLQPVAEIITGEPRLWMRAYLLFIGIVAAPVAEELVFRGVAFPVLARRAGMVPAALLVSLVFAAIHFHPEAVLPLFVVSMCFCAAYAVTGSLLVPMVMHALFNGVNLVVLLLVAP